MKKIIKYLIAVFSGLLLISCSKGKVSELPYYHKPDFTPLWLYENETGNIHKIGEFSFIDQNGKTISNSQLNGKIYIANFFFTTCPGICPAMMKNLTKVQSAFAGDNNVKMISYSVMPWVDNVPKLKNYEQNYSINGNMWYLATGNTREIYELARKSYFAEEESGYNSDSTEFLHTEHVLLVDKNGHLRGVYNGTLPLEINRLIDDITTLKKES